MTDCDFPSDSAVQLAQLRGAEKRRWWLAGLGLVMWAGLSGCSGGDGGGSGGGGGCGYGNCGGSPLVPTIESIQANVFTPRCTECHAGASAPLGLRLETPQVSYDNLVNVSSAEVPSLFRVEPTDPDNSYVIHKLEGTQSVGERMPRGRPPLDPGTIAVIRDWITDGALPPGSGAKEASVFLPAVELPEEPAAEEAGP